MQLRKLLVLILTFAVCSFSYLPSQAQDDGDRDRGDRREQRDRDRVPSWAIGRFKGHNRKYKVDTELTIRRDGSVTSHSRFDSGKRTTDSGTFRRGQIRVGSGTYDVESARDGIRLIQTTDRSNRAIYHKVD